MSTNDYFFIEQAEYIEDDWLLANSAEHPDEENIIRKLTQSGAKLITGPRGSGKTTLLKKAYYKMLYSANSSSFPVYVNFKSSLKLEPLYTNNANAVFWFNQWLLLKIYDGIYETIERHEIDQNIKVTYTQEQVKKKISVLELGKVGLAGEEDEASIDALDADISRILNQFNCVRCVLLLDDAAHAFSPQQQRDFFDFFRQIKSKEVSPKAAIYPGVTTYSPTFHVGHDAEEIDVWIKPEAPGYIEFMIGLLAKRLPEEVYEQISSNKHLLTLLCYASFGLPRLLLNMVRSFTNTDVDEEEEAYEVSNFDRKAVLSSVKSTFDTTYSVYASLKLKLPIYQHYIQAGEIIFDRIIQRMKEFNRGRDAQSQCVEVGIRRPIGGDLSRVLGFLQYSGLVLPKGIVNRGETGSFELYSVHYAALIEKNALLAKRVISVPDYVEAFSRRPHHTYPRIIADAIIGDANTHFKLSLPPCKVCNTPRTNLEARFCSNCGSPLATASLYDNLISLDIDRLPLTRRRITKIKEHSSIRKIRDILIDHEHKQLRQIPQIGPYWAKRIYACAEEFIG